MDEVIIKSLMATLNALKDTLALVKLLDERLKILEGAAKDKPNG